MGANKMLTFRKAGQNDIPFLAKIHVEQLIAEDSGTPYQDVAAANEAYMEVHYRDGTMVQYIGEEDGRFLCTGAIIFMDFPPGFAVPTGKTGYIANMYTIPAAQGRGLATKILGLLSDKAKAAGVSHLWLEASKYGLPVYKRFGFRDMVNWLQMDLPESDIFGS